MYSSFDILERGAATNRIEISGIKIKIRSRNQKVIYNNSTQVYAL